MRAPAAQGEGHLPPSPRAPPAPLPPPPFFFFRRGKGVLCIACQVHDCACGFVMKRRLPLYCTRRERPMSSAEDSRILAKSVQFYQLMSPTLEVTLYGEREASISVQKKTYDCLSNSALCLIVTFTAEAPSSCNHATPSGDSVRAR